MAKHVYIRYQQIPPRIQSNEPILANLAMFNDENIQIHICPNTLTKRKAERVQIYHIIVLTYFDTYKHLRLQIFLCHVLCIYNQIGNDFHLFVLEISMFRNLQFITFNFYNFISIRFILFFNFNAISCKPAGYKKKKRFNCQINDFIQLLCFGCVIW